MRALACFGLAVSGLFFCDFAFTAVQGDRKAIAALLVLCAAATWAYAASVFMEGRS